MIKPFNFKKVNFQNYTSSILISHIDILNQIFSNFPVFNQNHKIN